MVLFMIKRGLRFSWAVGLPVISAFLVALSLPIYDIAWIGWICLVPLLLVIARGGGIRVAFFLSYLCGIIFCAIVYNWIFEAPGYEIIHHAILALYLGSYVGLFGLLFSWLAGRLGLGAAFCAGPFIWVCTEYIRSNLSFLALPFPILGHSQHSRLALIQFVSVTGAYGVSFLIVSVNACIAMVLLRITGRHIGFGANLVSPSGRTVALVVTATGLLLAGVLLYGQLILAEKPHFKQMRITVIQGNIDREKKLDTRKNADFIMQRYVDLTRRAAKEGAKLIIWPEAATPGLLLKNRALHQRMATLVKEVNTHMVVGSSEHAKFAKDAGEAAKTGNTALFFSPQGKVLGQYFKIRLIPFGEYIPYEEHFPWPEFIVPKESRSYDLPGKEVTLFDLDETRFGVVICSEGAFPNLYRQFVKRGANLMLNITNEGWFGPAALYQKAAASVFRAVENRSSLARATNTGISCFIDPYGRILGRVNRDGREVSIAGSMTRDVPISDTQTLYTRYGDAFVASCCVIVSLFISAGLFGGKNRADKIRQRLKLPS